MFEVKITIEMPGIPEALNNLAGALALRYSNTGNALSMQLSNSKLDIQQQAPAAKPENPSVPTAVATPSATVAAPVPAAPTTGNVTTFPFPIASAPTSAPVHTQAGAATSVPSAPIAAQSVPSMSAPVSQPVPATPAVRIPTLDEISRAGAALVDAGKMDDVLNLCAKYGIQLLTEIPKNQFAAFAADLRALGADI